MSETIIKSEAEYETALAEVERLVGRDPAPSTPDADRLELLALLLQNYETRLYVEVVGASAPIPQRLPDPVEAIRFRMEQQGLTQRVVVRPSVAGVEVPRDVLARFSVDAEEREKDNRAVESWRSPVVASAMRLMPHVDRRAEFLARLAHGAVTDKSGKPYIGHPERVAERQETPEARAAAWLHDVVEDTGVTLEYLGEHFPPVVVTAVEALTRRKPPRFLETELYAAYMQRVRRDPVAVCVKLADMRDNLDPARVPPEGHPAREEVLSIQRRTRKHMEALREAGFDPAQHPREPAGSPGGGEFTAGGGAAGGGTPR